MKKCKYPLLIADCVMHEKNMYFFAQNYNALYAMNLKNEDCVLLDRIPDEKFWIRRGRIKSSIHGRT